jgi:hypothetical protein
MLITLAMKRHSALLPVFPHVTGAHKLSRSAMHTAASFESCMAALLTNLMLPASSSSHCHQMDGMPCQFCLAIVSQALYNVNVQRTKLVEYPLVCIPSDRACIMLRQHHRVPPGAACVRFQHGPQHTAPAQRSAARTASLMRMPHQMVAAPGVPT